MAFGWPDGAFFAGHKLGDGVIEMLEIAGDRKIRINRYEYVSDDIRLKASRVEDTNYSVTDQEWFREAIRSNDEHWSTLTTHPNGERLAAAFAAPIEIDQKPAGVLAIIIELTRVSNFLSQLTVGKSAGAFILDRDGARGRGARSECRRGDGAEDRPSAVSGRGRCDPPGRQRLQSRRRRAVSAAR